MKVAGVDGCRGGWIVVCEDNNKHLYWKMVTNIQDLMAFKEKNEIEIITIDIPIGLPSRKDGQREVDKKAREILRKRASSVFMAPIVDLVQQKDCYDYKSQRDFEDVCKKSKCLSGKKISKQIFCLFNKLRDVNDHKEEMRANKIKEFHPELCWSDAVSCSKKTDTGYNARIEDLAKTLGKKKEELHEFVCEVRKGKCNDIARDDVVDALCGLAVAQRISGINKNKVASIKESEDNPASEIYFIPR